MLSRFRRGMTVLERRLLREEVAVREVARAHRNVRNYKLSAPCRQAMDLAMAGTRQDDQRKLHRLCMGEDPGGPGCLCLCHDDNRSGVVVGMSTDVLAP